MKVDSTDSFQNQVAKVLTQGLIANFSGKIPVKKIHRSEFSLNAVDLQEDDISYHDEWIDARMSGGQELIRVGNEVFTRLYAGGIVDDQQLHTLGITEQQVTEFFTKSLLSLQDKTRLFTDCEPKPEGDWCYVYHIIDTVESPAVTLGKEVITYKDTTVFVHDFILCPITTAS